MNTQVGLRERKKEATRKALHEAAMRLAVEHGLDAVTVEAIADAAGVSRRTFSNYFAGKEDAVLYGDEQRVERLLRAFVDRPAEESSWTALRRALHGLYDELGEPEPQWAAQSRLARKHPSVLGRQLAHYASFERRLAEQIALRDGLPATSRRPRVVAIAFLASIRMATQTWIEEQPSRSLRAIVDEVLDEMARPFS
ncbi:TetR family transcriptional regulator [Actinomadura vinacea]|uniref:TetR family transcriptional regulator n=1 Tax=Actinomadura vinacea TaxID=115336 RepID=A0ABP5VET2_9ACTN